ncbi:MAG: hypothetical protein ACXWIN_03100 [Burkholderiaceae bacterium]
MSENKMEVRMAFTCCKISGNLKSIKATSTVLIHDDTFSGIAPSKAISYTTNFFCCALNWLLQNQIVLSATNSLVQEARAAKSRPCA